jgi:hypothetical protein
LWRTASSIGEKEHLVKGTTLQAKYCVGLLIAVHMSLLEAAAQPRKIVIDCDPGIDDAMAIVLALQYSGFEIVGISTMSGNAYVDQATLNALTVVDWSCHPGVAGLP